MKELIEKIKQNHSNDEEQLEVIFTDKKRIIVEAPAGYGKTKTMISRIAYLIATNRIPNPKKILALTFSVNAAYKIKKDVAENLPFILSNSPISPVSVKDKVFATNYHGFCRRVLRLYGYLLHESLRNIEYLRGVDDSKIEELINLEVGLDFSNAKRLSDYNDAIKEIKIQYLEDNYSDYIEKIKFYFLPNGYITFNAILLLTIELFKKYPAILKFYRTLFPIVIVDEFQDTNILSWTLLQLLIGEDAEVIFIGDPLQRIYDFIGAIPDLMTEATTKYDLHKIELKTNYRFKNNQQLLLLDKNIRENAKNPSSPSIQEIANIKTFQFSDQTEEAKGVLSLCQEILGNDPASKIAILVKQRGRNIDEILKAFKDTKFPFFYALYGDEEKEYIEFHQKSLKEFLDVVSNSGNKINKRIIQRFFKKVKNIFKNSDDEIYNSLLILLETFLNRIFIEFSFLSMEEKIELIKDVLESRSLKQYLGYVESKIIISTVHGGKGLEWDYIILPDMEQYSFPNYPGLCGICQFKNDCKINWNLASRIPDFERRFYSELSVFYVAVTRAKKEVFFTYSNKRIHHTGDERDTNVSCLLKLPGIKLNYQ
ncbi:UvrD-helicase domain-containing protein [Caldanaerobacter subterraneus]|uniref:DNA 3'-5' helicase n=1 Tax=Caldanaerobacter subterraneus subsp. pacificus DSM 12653 TaxID=391606 RepID=B7R798_9THEO|nr:ATP-dependent helicase [Caldanaerobacter subterraneus]KKC30236.1 superfamily I DNA/RNA helicase [Caldanaerobacter subterraneus subsp. pacificus DSM 12653]